VATIVKCPAIQSQMFDSNTKLHDLLTPCNRFLLENLTGSQLVKKFPAIYRNRRFITAFTSASYLPLS